jgi:hypothetical protein
MLAQMGRGKERDVAIKATQEEAAALVKLAAGPEQPDDTTKKRIARAADNLRWPIARTRHIWHGEVHIEVHEMDQLRRYALQEAMRRSERGTRS